jgi:membrane-associated phospholipid phosphatase
MVRADHARCVSLGSHDPAKPSVQLAAVVIFIVAFLVVSALVISGITQNVDVQLALAINNATLGEAFAALMIFFSKYGREYFGISIVGVMVLFGKRETKLLALELAALFIVGIFVGEILKSAIFRPRPFEALSDVITRVPIDTDSSYPSGHAIIVSIGAFFSLAKFKRRFVALLLTLEAAAVCYSRVYVGMHYPLDIVAGLFVGIAIVLGGLPILDRNLRDILNRLVSLFAKVLGDGLITL